MRLYIIVHVTAKDNNGFNRFDKYIYFFFRCGSKIAGRNGAKRRRTTRRICWDKKKAVASFPVSMDFSKARVLFVTKAPRPHRLFILIMEQTTGARELLVLATPPYSRAVTVWVTTHSAKYLHLARCHRKYRGRWVLSRLRCQAIIIHRMLPTPQVYRASRVATHQLMDTKIKLRSI